MADFNELGWMTVPGVGAGDFASRLQAQSAFDGIPRDTDWINNADSPYGATTPWSPGIQKHYLDTLRSAPPGESATFGLPVEACFEEEDAMFCRDFLSYMSTLGHIGSASFTGVRLDVPKLKLGVLHRSSRRAEQITTLQENNITRLLRMAGTSRPGYVDFVRKFVNMEITAIMNGQDPNKRAIRGYRLPHSNPSICLGIDGGVRLVDNDGVFPPSPNTSQRLGDMRTESQIIERSRFGARVIDVSPDDRSWHDDLSLHRIQGYAPPSRLQEEPNKRSIRLRPITRITNYYGPSAKDHLIQLAINSSESLR